MPTPQPNALESTHVSTELSPIPTTEPIIFSENENPNLTSPYRDDRRIPPNETNMRTMIYRKNFLLTALNKLFRDSLDEIFEDGMNSSFSDGLSRIILGNGILAISMLRIIMSRDHGGEVAEEALRQIGNMKDEKTHYDRRILLEQKLKSHDSRVRDAALTGIEYMDDPESIPSLEMAIKCEKGVQMRQNMKAVLVQLQNA